MDHLQRSLLNYFSLQPLDRVTHLRVDPDWIDTQRSQIDSQFYVLNNDKIITSNNIPIALSANQVNLYGLVDERQFYLGQKHYKHYFAINVDELSQIDVNSMPLASDSLRDLTEILDLETASILAYAQLINHWQLTTKYCRQCGNIYNITQGGHVMSCSSSACTHVEFPHINPAVIMNVTCGDKILLARQSTWPQNRYSVLAGFVEPGETLEHAVIREVKEESGIDIDKVQYHSSQPWPFPNSLMIGFCAQSRSMELELENDDLENALWLDADELTHHMDQRSVILSPPISISHRLIEDWYRGKTGQSIKKWQTIKPEPIVHENE